MKQYILIAILGCSIQIQAQTAARDTALQKTLVLEKEYTPTIDRAAKINSLPEIKEPEAPQSTIEFSNFSVPANVKPEPSQINAEKYFADLSPSKKRGYVKAGISTFINVDGDAGYQILNSDKDDLSVWLTHRSSSGNVKSLQTNEKLKLKLNDNVGGLRYAHNFGSSKLFADAQYIFSQFNYYGGARPETPGDIPLQTNNIFDANVGFLSKNELPINIFLAVIFTHFGQKDEFENGLKENILKINFDFNKDFDGDKTIGLAGYSGNSFYSFENPIDGYQNYGDIAFNPYFKMEGDNWGMRLGAFAHLLSNQTKKIFFTPDIELSFRPYESGLLYLTTKGNIADNSNSNIFSENRYMLPFERVLNSYTGFDGVAGFKTSLSGIFDMDFYAGYKIIDQEHFYFPKANNETIYMSGFSTAYYDTKVFKLGTNLKYQYGNLFDVSLKATYYNWKVSNRDESDLSPAEAWNKPSFVSDLTAGFQFPTIPLRADLIYHLETGRKSLNALNDIVNMKNINDISLMGTYTINETISVFARINNLLNQRYDIWYGYPAQGIRFMGGLSVKF